MAIPATEPDPRPWGVGSVAGVVVVGGAEMDDVDVVGVGSRRPGVNGSVASVERSVAAQRISMNGAPELLLDA